jgi:hypothetical protein
MTPDRPTANDPEEPDAPDTPSAAANLEIWAEPAECPPPPGAVTPAEVRYLVVTFGIMGTVAATTAGVLLLYRGAPQLALAEVVLGLAAIILIAIGGYRREV